LISALGALVILLVFSAGIAITIYDRLARSTDLEAHT
jgi:hypothetical protein